MTSYFIYIFFILFISCNDSNSNTIIDIYGCTEASATNYNPEANIDDQSCQYDEETHFNLTISETGNSTLFIFTNSITSLDEGDEIGLFDQNGILDSDGNTGEILVGHGTWNTNQLDIIAIHAVDLSQFGGPILPGAVPGNTLIVKVWDLSEQSVIDINYSIEAGTGNFNGLFTSINEIVFN